MFAPTFSQNRWEKERKRVWMVGRKRVPCLAHKMDLVPADVRANVFAKEEHMDGSRYEYVVSHVWMSHVTHTIESCHTYERAVSLMKWVMWRVYSSNVTHMHESRYTYEWGMSHMWMSRVNHTIESCHTCEWVTRPICEWVTWHLWTSHVIHIVEFFHKHAWVTWHLCHVTHII